MRYLDHEQHDLGELYARSRKYPVSVARGLSFFLLCVSAQTIAFRAVAAEPASPIRYELDLRQPAVHLVRVSARIADAPPSLRIQFPAWDALYQIRHFVRHMQDLEATCDGKPVVLRPVDADSWQTGPQACHDLEVRYAVFANEASVFSAVLDEQHAFLNLAQVLFYLPTARNCPVQVNFVLPDGWKLETLLGSGDSSNEYVAANYDVLADSPVEAGIFDEYSYRQKGAEYRVVVYPSYAGYASTKLLDAIGRITATETALMHDVPFQRYTFFLQLVPGESAGMEHADGAAIAFPPAVLGSDLEGLEALIAHEFFHLWNVKRIRPAGLEPIDYLHGNDTRDLWFSEGITSLYAELALVRSGLIGRREFYQHLADQIDILQGRPARHEQSAELSGVDAWLEAYTDYLRPERSISYYNKGELIGLLLDLGMRQASGNRAGLDDLLRALNAEFARRHRFFEDGDLIALIARLTGGRLNAEAFFRTYVTGVEELDYQKYLHYASLTLSEQTVEVPAWGFDSAPASGGPIRVESVRWDSAAVRAGLRPGDVLDSINGQPLTVPPGDLTGLRAGERVQLGVERGSRKLLLRFRLDGRTDTRYSIEEDSRATPAEAELRDRWLERPAE